MNSCELRDYADSAIRAIRLLCRDERFDNARLHAAIARRFLRRERAWGEVARIDRYCRTWGMDGIDSL